MHSIVQHSEITLKPTGSILSKSEYKSHAYLQTWKGYFWCGISAKHFPGFGSIVNDFQKVQKQICGNQLFFGSKGALKIYKNEKRLVEMKHSEI